jgi:NitT/TauT family transport system substrate-binding protein
VKLKPANIWLLLLLLLSLILAACGDATNTPASGSTTTSAATTNAATTTTVATTSAATGGAAATTSAATTNAAATTATGSPVAPGSINAPSKVVIAYQPGIGYANLIAIKRQKKLETAFPNTTFEWKVLASGAAIRDGMIAGQIQVGAGGVAPFLVGWDKGVGWKVLASLNQMDIWLVTKDPAIKSVKDIKPNQKIGMPAPDSIQSMVLRKAAQDQLGNAKALDNNIVAIEHSLGVQALANGQLAAHLTAPPFQFQEVEAGGQVILRSFDLFGQSTFNSVFLTQSFYDQYPDFAKFFYGQIADATKFINDKPDETAKLLAEEDQGKVTPEQYKTWLTAKGITFDTTPRGLLKYAEFMKTTGFLSKTPASIKDLLLPPLNGVGD